MKHLPVIAALTMACAPTVWAAPVSASVTMSNIRYQLTDLNPNDGITPALTFLPPDSSNSAAMASIADFSTAPATSDTKQSFGTNAFSSTSSTATLGSNFALGTVSSNGALSGTVLHAEETFDPQQPLVVQAAAALFNGQGAFSLTPQTRVTFLADVSFEASASLPAKTTNGAYLSLSQLSGPSITSLTDVDGTIQISTDNMTDFAGVGFSATAQVDVAADTNPAAPVPEPSTNAMLLAGLAFIGWVAGQRRKKAHA